MRALLLVLIAVMIAPLAAGAANLGLYFGYYPGKMSEYVDFGVYFDGYIYLHNAPYFITAVEYQLVAPNDPTHVLIGITSVEYPPTVSVYLGDPFSGHSIAFWPPLNGFDPGYNVICKISFISLTTCMYVGQDQSVTAPTADYPLRIGPHPATGAILGTYYPRNELFTINGLTSIICPYEMIAVENKSWGAIKSLF